jgi:5'-nucleotidase
MPTDQVRIAFDGDAVLFSDDSELVYRTQGLAEFQSVEDAQQDKPLEEGPYAALLKKLSKLQERLPGRVEFSPVRIAIVTSRSSPAELRVIKTLRQWGVYVDEAFFLGGVNKTEVLKAFKPHIFFDDQDIHLDPASRIVPAGKVPYLSSSRLHQDRDESADVSP